MSSTPTERVQAILIMAEAATTEMMEMMVTTEATEATGIHQT
jgi:hypothetical protein